MTWSASAFSIVALVSLASGATAQTPPVGAPNAPAQARPAVPVFPTAPPPPYVTPETPQGTGAHPAIMEVDPGLTTHTIYRPNDLASMGSEKLPVVAFGNGACVNMGNRFRYFLTEIASHGFLAIAIGPLGAKELEGNVTAPRDPNAPAPQAPPAADPGAPRALPPAATRASQLIDAINWAIAENSRQGSKYYGKLETTKIAVMGQSCGGLQAIDAAHDPRVTTLGVWNSGVLPEGQNSQAMSGANATKESLLTLHAPTIYVTGEASDSAYPNAEDDFSRINHLPVFRAWREKTGHVGTYREPNGGAFAKVGVAWLQWQLKGNQTAAKMFVGADCGLCTNPEWHVKKKKID